MHRPNQAEKAEKTEPKEFTQGRETVPLFFDMKDLQTLIADYASKNELEISYRMRPSVEVLPGSGQEGDVLYCDGDGTYYIYNGGKWNLLAEDTELEEIELATREDVLSAIQAGKEAANG